MSKLTDLQRVIECVGDPRSMGNTQGLAFRDEIQERIRRSGGRANRNRVPSLLSLTSGAVLGGGAGREVIRHYTHLAERMTGIARHSEVRFSELMKLFCRATAGALEDEPLVATAIAVAGQGLGGASNEVALCRSLPESGTLGSRWLVRKSRPEVGFASVEITLPWLASAVAGINEAGIAVALAPRVAQVEQRPRANPVGARRDPDAVLLVQECLQRFDSISACVDWCHKRPRSGFGTLVLADATGELAGVEIAASECRSFDAVEGLLIGGASHESEKRLREARASDSLVSSQFFASLPECSAPGCLATLEPAARSLIVAEPGDGRTLRIELA